MQGIFGRNDCGSMGNNDCCWTILLLMLLGNCGCGIGQNIDICTLLLLLVILGSCNGGGRQCC